MNFTKMHGIGNDYIYFDCTEQTVEHPEQLAVTLSDRHKGVGGDGIVLIMKSDVAAVKGTCAATQPAVSANMCTTGD